MPDETPAQKAWREYEEAEARALELEVARLDEDLPTPPDLEAAFLALDNGGRGTNWRP